MISLCLVDMSHCFGSSFNDQPVNVAATGPIGKELFEKEQEDLLTDLKDIPKKACDRRVSYFIHVSLCFLFT
jgi:EH domain-containing protein 1